jgi:hypothetical protein
MKKQVDKDKIQEGNQVDSREDNQVDNQESNLEIWGSHREEEKEVEMLGIWRDKAERNNDKVILNFCVEFFKKYFLGKINFFNYN